MTKSIRFLVAVAAVCLSAGAAFAADVPLEITVGDTTIAVANATPGGSVVLFAAGLDGSRGVLRQRRLAQQVTANAAGALAYEPARPFPYRTIFVAVDVESGRLAIGGPRGYEVQVRPFPAGNLKHEADGVSGVDAEIPRAELLVVRPKGGAWRLAASEGESGDGDRLHDGRLALDFSAATPLIAGEPAPKRLKNKDVVVLIDSARLEVFTTEISR